jgi:hypothetical protein
MPNACKRASLWVHASWGAVFFASPLETTGFTVAWKVGPPQIDKKNANIFSCSNTQKAKCTADRRLTLTFLRFEVMLAS